MVDGKRGNVFNTENRFRLAIRKKFFTGLW